ncbi:MAG: hypothetical protein DWQ06_15280 [Calditrichaeota bacterium]|nr:MAG: hypothetical protein DWQ06_15280 [Calditrichota bacterium]
MFLFACDSTEFEFATTDFENVELELVEFVADSSNFYTPEDVDGRGNGDFHFVGAFNDYKTATLFKFNSVSILESDTVFVDSIFFRFYAEDFYYRRNAFQAETLSDTSAFPLKLYEYPDNEWEEESLVWSDLDTDVGSMNFLQNFVMDTNSDSILFVGDSLYSGTDSATVKSSTRFKQFSFRFYEGLLNQLIDSTSTEPLSFLLYTEEGAAKFARAITSVENGGLGSEINSTNYLNFGVPSLEIYFHTVNVSDADSVTIFPTEDTFVVTGPTEVESSEHFWVGNGSDETVKRGNLFFDLSKNPNDGSEIDTTVRVVRAEISLTLDETLSQRLMISPQIPEDGEDESLLSILTLFRNDTEDTTLTVSISQSKGIFPQITDSSKIKLEMIFDGDLQNDRFSNFMQTILGDSQAKFQFRITSDESDFSQFAFFNQNASEELRPKIRIFFAKQPEVKFE